MQEYMCIEYFNEGCLDKIYSRLEQKGRMLPDGLYFINSWVNRSENICFQLMKTHDPKLFDIWMEKWSDLVTFQLFEVQSTQPI